MLVTDEEGCSPGGVVQISKRGVRVSKKGVCVIKRGVWVSVPYMSRMLTYVHKQSLITQSNQNSPAPLLVQRKTCKNVSDFYCKKTSPNHLNPSYY